MVTLRFRQKPRFQYIFNHQSINYTESRTNCVVLEADVVHGSSNDPPTMLPEEDELNNAHQLLIKINKS